MRVKHRAIGQMNAAAHISPVEEVRKQLPRGNGNWPGYAHVYNNIARACEHMARNGLLLTDEHINTMAVLGCGDEKTMKYEQMRLTGRGFI